MKKHPHAGLFDARGVRVGKLQGRGGARGTITTVARLPCSIGLDGVVPVLTQDDSAGGWIDSGAIHALVGHGIQLLRLGEEPVIPVGEPLQLATCEAAKGLFFFCPKSGSIETAHQKQELIVRERLMHDRGTGHRCCCDWGSGRRVEDGKGPKGVDEAELVHGQM